jgi:hypothetical protein
MPMIGEIRDSFRFDTTAFENGMKQCLHRLRSLAPAAADAKQASRVSGADEGSNHTSHLGTETANYTAEGGTKHP